MLFFLTGGQAVAQLAEVLCYKPESRGFDSRLCYNHSGRTMALGSTHPLTEMSTSRISWGWTRPVRRADKPTTFVCRFSWNMETSTSWKLHSLSRPAQNLFCFYSFTFNLSSLSFSSCSSSKSSSYFPLIFHRLFFLLILLNLSSSVK